MKRPGQLAGLCIAVIVLLGGTIAHAGQSSSTAAFERLVSLVGEWTGEQNGRQIRVTYSLVADGSTLVEEFRSDKGATMMTMFTVDGEHLVATHYCSAHNQPQMVTQPISGAEANPFNFSLDRITGMSSPDDWHNTGLEFQLEDKDHLSQEWTYLDHGKMGTTIFHLARKKA